MGKGEDEQVLSTIVDEAFEENAENRCRIGKLVRVRCIVSLVFGLAVLLSGIFWLPPFLKYGRDRGDLDQDEEFGANILASFRLQRPVSVLKENIPKLEYDIFDEIGVLNTTVIVASLEPLAGSNWTNVVFGFWPYPKKLTISSAGLSLLRASFLSLVIQQSTLHLTPTLFGVPSFFQVLKFPGGITVIPPQSAFLLQKVQILFNFTLNFSINQIQENFSELKNQLISGLRLTSYENLYVSLTNVNGSTLAPPTIVQSSVLLAVGNLPPSSSRLKQLAQAITGSPAKNLGLNHTVFGKVKQIQLSSFLQHSLNSSSTNSSSSVSSSPAPPPHPDHQHQHHHHHHHHHHQHHHHHHNHHHHRHDPPADVHLTPAPAPNHRLWASPPSGCRFGFLRKPNSRAHLVPAVAPVGSPRHPVTAPRLHVDPPTPAPNSLPSSPLPAVFFAHVQPPSRGETHNAPDLVSPSPVPSPFSVAGHLPRAQWPFAVFLYLLMHL